MKKITYPHVCRAIFIGTICLAFSGLINSATALGLGFLFSLFIENPYPNVTKKGIKHLLKISIVGLGFGILFEEALSATSDNIGLLSISVILTVGVGISLTAFMRLDKKLGFLITSGTAICGGSAIAAVSPVIRADSKYVSIALAVVFALNAIALLIFPPIGKLVGLTQQQFGVWSAIAIHDTSSVVGAAMSYGDEALKIATTLKLSRSLWIIPLAFFAMFWFRNTKQKIAIPYFIGAFIIAIAINSLGILPPVITTSIVWVAKHLLVVTLFLIGTSLSLSDIRHVGIKPLIFAVCLWFAVSLGSLLYIAA